MIYSLFISMAWETHRNQVRISCIFLSPYRMQPKNINNKKCMEKINISEKNEIFFWKEILACFF